MAPQIEVKVKYLMLAQAKTENPIFDKKNTKTTNFQIVF